MAEQHQGTAVSTIERDLSSAEHEVVEQIEGHHIDIIPDSERRGRPWDQFTLWFATNSNPVNLVIGGLAVIFGLNLFWAIVAIVVGTGLGMVLTAFHAGQGPRLGVPQMIQSRGQFGFWGTEFILLASVVLDVGYLAAGVIIGGTAMHSVIPSVSEAWWIVILAIPSLLLAIFGYWWIHRVQRYLTVVLAGFLIYAAIRAFTFHSGIAASERGFALPAFPLFLAVVGITFMNMLSWAVFVSDYSRYLPSNVSFKRTYWSIFLGCFVSTCLYASLGAYVTALAPKTGTLGAMGAIAGSWVLVFLACTNIAGNTLPPYTAALAVVSLFSNNAKVMAAKARRSFRVIGVTLVTLIAVIVSLADYHNFATNFEEFLTVLLFLFVPWSAINLVDYYWVKKGNYTVPAFFRVSGRYGAWQPAACICYAVAVAVQIPFIDVTLYKGPAVTALGGANISWLLGFVVAGGLYLLVSRIQERGNPTLGGTILPEPAPVASVSTPVQGT